MRNTKPWISVLLLAMALVFAAGCKKNNTNGNPDDDVVVTTYKPSAITASTAACGCDVKVVEGLSLTKIGVCWSTSKNPTVEDANLSSETWDEPFTCTLTGLASGTTYHVRGFALRGLEYYYGDDRTFTTLGSGGGGSGGNGGDNANLPSVATKPATEISSSSAMLVGELVSDGGVTASRGLCWSTSSDPTVEDATRDCGTGLGSYSVNLVGLSPNTTYHFRAYAENSYGVAYGDDVSFTTAAGSGSTTPPIGAINGLFSVSPTKQVWFSQGNLQYKASSKTWRFAEEQWHYVGTRVSGNSNGTGGNVSGSSNHLVSSSYSGWIDWFCWGTSGYNHGAVAYQPWSTSGKVQDYYAYGSPNYNLYDQTGQADWGYNKISNGGNQENYGWRTPTIEEWEYLIDGRNTPSGIRYVCAKVNGVYGLILLPDNWVSSIYELKYPNLMTNGNDNVISASNWANKLQATGAVFLPEAGYRLRSDPTSDLFCVAHFQGIYWSSSSSQISHSFEFRITYVSQSICYSVAPGVWGVSVRLVKDYQ